MRRRPPVSTRTVARFPCTALVRARTRAADGAGRSAVPADAEGRHRGIWHFELPEGCIEPLLKALIEGGAGIEELSIERPGLHDAFVAIAGEAAARQMETDEARDGEAAECCGLWNPPMSSGPGTLGPRHSPRLLSSCCLARLCCSVVSFCSDGWGSRWGGGGRM